MSTLAVGDSAHGVRSGEVTVEIPENLATATLLNPNTDTYNDYMGALPLPPQPFSPSGQPWISTKVSSQGDGPWCK